ncbi:MAG TPA: hypothetical protein VFF43_16135, partial [Caldimonas sp.]|nr:hypothetical protein [Caldimonas sp.]
PAGIMRTRYEREIERLGGEVERLQRKLANDAYVSKASPEAVSKDRAKLAGYEAELARARSGLAALGESSEDR